MAVSFLSQSKGKWEIFFGLTAHTICTNFMHWYILFNQILKISEGTLTAKQSVVSKWHNVWTHGAKRCNSSSRFPCIIVKRTVKSRKNKQVQSGKILCKHNTAVFYWEHTGSVAIFPWIPIMYGSREISSHIFMSLTDSELAKRVLTDWEIWGK